MEKQRGWERERERGQKGDIEKEPERTTKRDVDRRKCRQQCYSEGRGRWQNNIRKQSDRPGSERERKSTA